MRPPDEAAECASNRPLKRHRIDGVIWGNPHFPDPVKDMQRQYCQLVVSAPRGAVLRMWAFISGANRWMYVKAA
jgi:hypothetical protein